MVFDSFVLRQVLNELGTCLLNTAVQKIRQSENRELVLEVRAPGATFGLLMSWDPRFARIYLSSSGIKPAPKAPDFCMILRKHLTGCSLTDIRQLGRERIARLTFENAAGERFYLYQEIMGRHSDITLTDSEGVILGVAKPVGSSISAARQLLIGRKYTLPPRSQRPDPFEIDRDAFCKIVSEIGSKECDPRFIKAFTGVFSGFSGQLAKEVWLGLSPADAGEAFDRIRSLKSAGAGCFLLVDEKGRAEGVYPVFLHSLPAERQKRQPSINEALDAAFRSIVARDVRETVRRELLSLIDKSIDHNEALLASCRETAEKAPLAERNRELGNLLFGNLHSVNKGDAEVSVTDYYDPEMKEAKIPLDPALSPAENAEKYYRRSKRLKASVKQAEERIPGIEERLLLLEEAREAAVAEEHTKALRELRSGLLEKGLLREVSQAEEETRAFAGYRIKRVYSPEGWEILYGESAEANDYLTGRIARPNDIWLHARQITGSHVIIRATAKNCARVPRETILFASRIAAANSAAKHSSLVPVDHTFRKYVRKPKGSPAGFVLYRQEKTIDVGMNRQRGDR